MNASLKCKECLFNKNISNAQIFSKEQIVGFEKGVTELIEKFGNIKSAPYIQSKIDELYGTCFGKRRDFNDIKKTYNLYMLEKEEIIRSAIQASDDIISACIKFACVGNYIDFGVIDNVDSNVLERIFEKAKSEELNSENLLRFKKDLEKAKKLVYLTDNCGEIVLDKVFMEFLKNLYPELTVTAVVRGGDTLNDATLSDAEMIGLGKVADVISNGTAIPGTDIEEISDEAKKALQEADIIISKGQGNFETIFGEGFNTYFIFMCKCQMFVERFGLKQYSLVFANENDIKKRFPFKESQSCSL